MSKVIKGIGKFIKKTTKFGIKLIKKYWKPLLIAAATVFTAGIATVGIAGFSSLVASQGVLGAVASTAYAGGTAILGTVGIGAGAAGSAAAATGTTGATLFSGSALAGALGGVGPAAAGGAAVGPGAAVAGGLTGAAAPVAGSAVAGGTTAAATPGLLSQLAPSILTGVGNYLTARGQQEAARPEAVWGVPVGEDAGAPPPYAQSVGGGQQQPDDFTPQVPIPSGGLTGIQPPYQAPYPLPYQGPGYQPYQDEEQTPENPMYQVYRRAYGGYS